MFSRKTAWALAAGMIVAGTLLRLPLWHLPLPIHHIGGGLLWGAMLYALAAALRPPNAGVGFALAAALGIIVAVESSRLIHTPDLDAFRLTLAGQWLLGRLFSPWNILVDGLGALAAAGAMAIAARRACRARRC